VTQSAIDPQVLAALLEGRLPARERVAVMARLAASEPALEAYIDAVAVMSELQPGPMIGDRGPARSAPDAKRWRLPPKRWLAIAAVLAGVALAPWLTTRSRPSGRADPGGIVAQLQVPTGGLPAGWDGRPWSSVRGAEQPLTPRARAIRLGARLVDLELAVAVRDPAAANLAGDIAALLEALPAAGPVTAMYRDIARDDSASSQDLEPLLAQAGTAAARLAGADPTRLGAWAEAARIAAARRDAGFFRAEQTRAALEQASNLLDPAEPARAAVQRLRAALAPERAPDWSALERDLTELLRGLAS
jgi:hypothetical protein